MSDWTPAELENKIWWTPAADKLTYDGEYLSMVESTSPEGYAILVDEANVSYVPAHSPFPPYFYKAELNADVEIDTGSFLSSSSSSTMSIVFYAWLESEVTSATLLSSGGGAIVTAVQDSSIPCTTDTNAVFYVNGTLISWTPTEGEMYDYVAVESASLLCIIISVVPTLFLFSQFTGDFDDIIIFNHSVSDEDREKAEWFLADKAGTLSALPDDHPYKTTGPGDTEDPEETLFTPEDIPSIWWWDTDDDDNLTWVSGYLDQWYSKTPCDLHLHPVTSAKVSAYSQIPRVFYQQGAWPTIVEPRDTNFVNLTSITIILPLDMFNDETALIGKCGVELGRIIKDSTESIVLGHPSADVHIWVNGTSRDGITAGELYNEVHYEATIISITASGLSNISGSMFLGSLLANGSFTFGFRGNIYDVIMYPGVMTTEQRQMCEGYLAHNFESSGFLEKLDISHPYKYDAPVAEIGITTPCILSQPYDEMDMVQTYISQPYGQAIYITTLTQPFEWQTLHEPSLLQQLYGEEMFAVLQQPYDDADMLLATLEQYYGNAKMFTSVLRQKYDEADMLLSVLKQPLDSNDVSLSVLRQPYLSITPIEPGILRQQYDIPKYTEHIAVLTQQYSATVETNPVEMPTISISMNGINVDVLSIDYEYDIDVYCAKFTFTVLKDVWESLEEKDNVITTIDGTPHNTIVISKSSATTAQSRTYSVETRSPAALLDYPFASSVPDDFVVEGAASAVINDLAALCDLSISWELDSDPPQTDDSIDVIGDSPLSGIRDIVNQLGGRLQSRPDGSIHAVKRYSINSNKYDDAEVTHTFTTGLDFTVLNTETDQRDGFNFYTVSSGTVTDGYSLTSESEDDSHITIYATKVPWSSAAVLLDTSETTGVTITTVGREEIEVEDEVEIVDGAGTVDKPYYGSLTWNYGTRTDLGDVSITEAGVVTTAEEGNSMVTVKYNTRHWRWDVSDLDSKNVQFILVKP